MENHQIPGPEDNDDLDLINPWTFVNDPFPFHITLLNIFMSLIEWNIEKCIVLLFWDLNHRVDKKMLKLNGTKNGSSLR